MRKSVKTRGRRASGMKGKGIRRVPKGRVKGKSPGPKLLTGGKKI